MKTPHKLFLILILFVISFLYALPKELPLKLDLFGVKIDTIFYKPIFSKNVGNLKITNNKDLVLGLDLAGGSKLTFEVDTSKIDVSKRSVAINIAKNIIEKRVNLFGVSEPNLQTSSFENKDRIIVELPGITDPKDAIDLIGKTALLSFAEVSEEDGGLNETELTGADLVGADVVYDSSNGKPVVAIEFNEQGATKFENITGENIGKALPILLDGQIVSAPIVQDKITGGNAQITGDFTVDEAKNLSIQLNSGALPVPIKIVEQRTIGATLGSDSIDKSVIAGLIGVFMVSIFMIAIYGRFGVIAVMGLVVFGTITLALYKIIPVVLTLPGIAGFLLSVGMAVDSNILIFERFKEEKDNRPLSDALEVSFGRAWDPIRDANIATLITAFILANPLDWNFLHVSGPVRGFAITLALGIGISLFTGVVVTRNLVRFFIKRK